MDKYIEDLFVPYNESLALKELGFDKICFTYHKNNQPSDILELVKNSEMVNVNNEVNDYIAIPTYSQAFKFIRDKYNVDGEVYLIPLLRNDIEIEQYKDKEYSFRIYVNGVSKQTYNNHIYPSYELAEYNCLKELINIVK